MLENFIFHIGGDICLKLAHALEELKEKEITDQELAEKLGEDINTTRKNLYKLLDYNLVIYRRTRDKSNGWIVFFFKSNFDGYESILVERNQKQVDKWKQLLEYEKDNMFYACDAGCTRLPFDKATEIDFRCPSCDEILNFRENDSKINDLSEKIKRAEAEIEEITGVKKSSSKSKTAKSKTT